MRKARWPRGAMSTRRWITCSPAPSACAARPAPRSRTWCARSSSIPASPIFRRRGRRGTGACPGSTFRSLRSRWRRSACPARSSCSTYGYTFLRGKNVNRRRLFLLLGLVLPLSALAQPPDYPPSQIRFIVPFTPGGGTDVIMRLVAHHLAEGWKITALVENRVGAGGVIGSQYVTTQPPDGRTFLAVASAFGVRSAIDRSVPYDIAKDFTGVAQLARSPSFMVVSTERGFR